MLSNHPRIRVAIYLASVAVSIAAVLVAVLAPEWGQALTVVAGILAGTAGVTAVSNLTPHD